MAEPETKKKNTSSLIMLDWSQLLEELLEIISKNLEDAIFCFDVVHARSVYSSWRSTFPFPSSLIHASYSLPKFDKFPLESEGLCTLEKVPSFLFRLRAPTTAPAAEFLIGGIEQDESEDYMQLPSPIQCSVKVKIPRFDPTLMKMLDCQILPLGHQYRIIGRNSRDYNGIAFILLNKERGEEGFIVLLNCFMFLLVLTSAEMRWKRLENAPESICWNLVTFRGKFYATFVSGKIGVIDPYTLVVTLLLHSPQNSLNYLVPSGNDELFLVKLTLPRISIGELDTDELTLRVSRLHEKAGIWVEISDLGDRVLFIDDLRNFSCSAKELPHDCGVSGNSIMITKGPDKLTFAFKYVHTGNAEDDINCWSYSRKNRVMKLHIYFPVIALRILR